MSMITGRSEFFRNRFSALAEHAALVKASIILLMLSAVVPGCNNSGKPDHVLVRDFISLGPTTRLGYAGVPLTEPLTVSIGYARCNTGPVGGCTDEARPTLIVNWDVPGGGGKLSETVTQIVYPDHQSSVVWTPSVTPGTSQIIAEVLWPAVANPDKPAPASIVFTVTTVSRKPVLSLESGADQTTTPGASLGDPVVVKLTVNKPSGERVPLAGATVNWVAQNPGGVPTPLTSVTDTEGKASTVWRLAPTSGVHTLRASTPASAADDPTSVFVVDVRATAQVAPARRLRVVSGDQQRGIVNRAEAQPLILEYVLVDPATSIATPIPNALVAFAPSAGSVVPLSLPTDAQGRVRAQWTLGAAAGTQSVRVSTPVVPNVDPQSIFDVTITATAEPVDLLFQDDFSAGSLWSAVVARNDLNAWSHSESTVAAGGNPGGYRHMVHTLNINTLPDFVTLFVQHRFTGATYDPATQGAIVSIDYSEDRQPTGAAYGSFLIVQNGLAYEALLPDATTPSNTWQAATLTNLRPSNFSPAPGPNFSSSGATMQFGFVRGNSARVFSTVSHDIDNWKVVVHR